MSEAICISGELTLDTVAARTGEIEALLAGRQSLTLDLSGVSNVDSSSLPLLLCWLLQARALQLELKLVGLPDAIQQLIDVYDLRELLLPSAKP